MTRKPLIATEVILSIMTLGVLAVFWWGRLELGQVRYFDADELAYLHWAHNLLSGQRPYLDFFFYVPPGFLVFLAPLFWLGGGVTPLIASRVLAWLIFLALSIVSALLFWQLRRSWVAIVAPLVLAFLPLPADKLLEIRPDNLATLLSLSGLWLQIYVWQTAGGSCPASPSRRCSHSVLSLHERIFQRGRLRADGALPAGHPPAPFLVFLSGVLYGLSLIVLPKTLPAVAVALIVVWLTRATFSWRRFLVGLVVPLGALGMWLATWGDLEVVAYSLFKLPFEVNRLGEVFPMQPYHFFYPNLSFYGSDGYPLAWWINHGLWIIGLLVGCGRLVTPFLPNGRKGALAEVLVSGILTAQVALYILYLPMRHAQYLIPVAVLVAWYVADGVNLIWQVVKRFKVGQWFFGLAVITSLLLLYQVFTSVNRAKLTWTNAEELTTLQTILTTVPQDAYVLDLVGLTFNFRDPYYACCLPFGQYRPYLSRPLPSLTQALEKTETRYIFQGRLERVKILLPADQAYIKANFRPLLPDGQLLIRR